MISLLQLRLMLSASILSKSKLLLFRWLYNDFDNYRQGIENEVCKTDTPVAAMA